VTGGTQLVEAGGRAVGTTLSTPFTAVAIVLAGGVESSATVYGLETLSAGGSDFGALIISGGSQVVFGRATSATVVSVRGSPASTNSSLQLPPKVGSSTALMAIPLCSRASRQRT